MSNEARRKAEVISTFTDHGTGETFEKDSTPMIEVGRFGNFEAAGLVRVPVVSVPRTAPKKKAATKRKTAVRAAPKAPAEPAPSAETPASTTDA